MAGKNKKVSFDTSYQVIYLPLEGKEFLHRRPGKQTYIALKEKDKGDINHLLDALISFTEADRALSVAERSSDIVIFLDDNKLPYKHLQGSVSPGCPPVYVQPYQADHASFCPN